jgi:hypothetical protein
MQGIRRGKKENVNPMKRNRKGRPSQFYCFIAPTKLVEKKEL